MAAPRTLREVNAGLEVLNARRARRVRRSAYGAETIGPLREAIEGNVETSKSSNVEIGKAANRRRLGKLLGTLGPALYRRMKTEALEEELAAQEIQARLIGRTAARPREKN